MPGPQCTDACYVHFDEVRVNSLFRKGSPTISGQIYLFSIEEAGLQFMNVVEHILNVHFTMASSAASAFFDGETMGEYPVNNALSC